MWKFWNMGRGTVDCFLVTAPVNWIKPILAKGDK
jgi:hypothetical protein